MEVWGTSARGTAVQQVPRRLEVIGAEGGHIRESRLSVKRLSSEKVSVFIKGTRDCQKGKLQVLGPKEEIILPPVETPPWPGPEGSKRATPRKKVYTPTKQISLSSPRAASSLSPRNDIPTNALVDRKSSWSSPPNLRSLNGMHENKAQLNGTESSLGATEPHHSGVTVEEQSRWTTLQRGDKEESIEKAANSQSNGIHDPNIKEKQLESTDDDDNGDTGCSSDEHDKKERRAPIELMAEFLQAIMVQDYTLSSKLCEMILIYEPENSEAQQFLPLIKERVLMEEREQISENENDDETDDESSDSEDSSDDESEDSSETSHSSSDSEPEL